MLQIVSNKMNVDFLSKGKLALVLSVIILLGSVVSLATQGMNLGLDFTGGTVVEVGYPEPVVIEDVRQTLEGAGYGHAQVQFFGTAREVLIRIQPREGEDTAGISTDILAALQAEVPAVEMRRVEFVGPQVGDELVEQGSLAALYALIGILIYVTLRFEWRLALGTLASTIHDAVFVVGMFSVLQIEFDLTTLAAVLAVIGYSVNDSVVVLDRIRENFRLMRRESPKAVMNASINQTMSRTLITSGTTLIAVTVLYFFGGPAINHFALAMIVGIVVGTYSSIYIASATAMYLGVKREDLLPRAKEADDRP